MDTPPRPAAQPLRDRLAHRRRELRISQAEAARRAGVGRMAWYEWEAGRRGQRDSNYAGIEDALLWGRGSVAAILAGGEPTELPVPQLALPDPAREAFRDAYQAWRRQYGHARAMELLQAELDRLNAEPTGLRTSRDDRHSA
jgi:transcriptional regulator with XRE-family HTH domain